jgi:hypothetical protein
MAWAAKKHAVQLDPAWKLPKMRYKGDTVQPQLLRLDRGPVSHPAEPTPTELSHSQPCIVRAFGHPIDPALLGRSAQSESGIGRIIDHYCSTAEAQIRLYA